VTRHVEASHAQVAVVGVLDALAVLGLPVPNGLAVDRAVLAMNVRHLGLVGASLAWQTSAEQGVAAVAPWTHLSSDRWVVLRAAYGDLLAERRALHAPPVSLPASSLPPDEGRDALHIEGGCLCCGVAAVSITAAEVTRLGGPDRAGQQVWHRLRVVVGGDHVAGHLCPDCHRAWESVRSFGPSLAEHAYLAHLRTLGREQEADRAALAWQDGIPAPVTYAARVVAAVSSGLAAVPEPSPTPWQHVGRRR
jgi:hypothetical protein